MKQRSSRSQVIPTPLHVLGRISPIFSPFFPVFLRVFTVSTRRFQRAQNRNPGPRNSVKGATDKRLQEELYEDYLYYEGIRFIGMVKTGPFFEHSVRNPVDPSCPFLVHT